MRNFSEQHVIDLIKNVEGEGGVTEEELNEMVKRGLGLEIHGFVNNITYDVVSNTKDSNLLGVGVNVRGIASVDGTRYWVANVDLTFNSMFAKLDNRGYVGTFFGEKMDVLPVFGYVENLSKIKPVSPYPRVVIDPSRFGTNSSEFGQVKVVRATHTIKYQKKTYSIQGWDIFLPSYANKELGKMKMSYDINIKG